MILRRVIEHIRKQEWTAILIDLVIVVVGVFIGIQVSNWNTERETNRRAAVFTERLKADLRMEAWGYDISHRVPQGHPGQYGTSACGDERRRPDVGR